MISAKFTRLKPSFKQIVFDRPSTERRVRPDISSPTASGRQQHSEFFYREQQESRQRISSVSLPRRVALGLGTAVLCSQTQRAKALGFTKDLKRKEFSADELVASDAFSFRGASHVGIQYFDSMQGNGDALEVGDIAVVHFTCRYRGLSAVSSREARTLGGNRTIAEPLEFKYGRLPGELNKPLMRKSVVGIGAEVRVDPELGELYVINTAFNGPAERAGMRPNDSIISIDGNRNLPERPISEIGALLTGEIGTDIELVVKRRISRTDESIETFKLVREETTVVPKTRNVNIEGGGGLFIGASGPRPPPVIFIPEVLAGMRTGGRRTIMVSPDVGYEDIGEGEIPPGASFKLEVELLQVKTVAS